MASLLYPAQAAIDEEWFSRILPHIDELYISLGIPHQQLAQLRTSFEAKPFNPDLRPLATDVIAYRQRNKELSALKEELSASSVDPIILQAYMLKIDELVTQNNLLLAAVAGDADALAHFNRELYGTPDPTVFAGVCVWLRQIANEYYNSAFPYLAASATAVLEHSPDLKGAIQSIIPDDHTFKQVRQAHLQTQGYIDQLLGTEPIPEFVTTAEGDPLTVNAIEAVGSAYRLTDSTDHLWGVIHSEHRLVRPAGYALSRSEFIGIVSHEVGSHLLERENGLRQPLRLLSVGLDKYEASNEGRAFLREQIMYTSPYELLGESAWEHIILLYLSTSLSSGVHREPYSFTGLYEAILPVCQLLKGRHLPDNPVVAEAQARDEAWQICTRAAKGTMGAGGAFGKGLVYLGGNLSAWKLAAESPDYIFYGDAGKFDISRADHREILKACGVTPQSYQALT